MTETPDTMHGRLLEAVHISGYTFERAFKELDWLLTDGRWKQVGSGFDDISEFLATIDLSEFKLAAKQRKKIAKKLEALEATQRETAQALGVGLGTINRDLAVPDGTKAPPRAHETDASEGAYVPDGTPASITSSGAAAATAADKAIDKQAKRREREDTLRAQRAEREEAAREEIAAADGLPYLLHHGSLADWRPADVAAIITDPPYVGNSIPLYELLRDFAYEVLPDGGALVVMTWQAILPDVIKALDHPGLAYRWTISWRYANTENTVDQKRRVFDCWKPILVYHAGAMSADAPMVRDEISSEAGDKDFHEWGQSLDGFERLVRSFSQPGDLICDPFLGGGTTAIAALAEARRFVGCDIDEQAINTTRERLAA